VRRCILLAILAAGTGVLLADAPPAQARQHRIGPADIYPDPARTPGAANPQVTQRNIQDNICNPRWSTKLIRPPSEYTSKLKRRQLPEYGDTVHQTRAQLINPSTGKVDAQAVRAAFRQPGLLRGGPPYSVGGRRRPLGPEEPVAGAANTHVGGVNHGRLSHDEICYGIPGSKKTSYIPATTPITLKWGQEILAGDWYACYEAIKNGEPCR